MRGLKHWLLRAAVAAAVCLVGLVAYTVYDGHQTRSAGERQLAAVVARLDADDPGWRLADLLAAREARFPPPDHNPMALIQRVHPRTPPVVDQWSREQPNWLPADPNRRPLPRHSGGAACVRDECRATADELHRLKPLPPGGYRLDIKPNPINTLIEPTQQVRGVAYLLQLDAVTAALSDDPDRAVSACHACLAAGRGIGDEPFLISMLVRVAVTTIAAGTTERVLGLSVPWAGLAELQAALLAEADAPLLADALRGERAMWDRVFDGLESGDAKTTELGTRVDPRDDPLAALGAWKFRAGLPADRAEFLRILTEYLAIARRPPDQRAAAFAAVPGPPVDPDDRSTRYIVTRLLLPAIDKVSAAEVRSKAVLRTAAVGLACERFRLEHARWPATLAELGPLLPAVPADPYTGRPLRLVRRADGLTIYAVGADGTDDGGTNLSARGEPGTDLGFRLWDVAHRAADPPADPEPDEEEKP